MTIKLSQTVAGNWVITIPNPEEAGWETQLAEFNMEAVAHGTPAYYALKMAAASALLTLWSSFQDRTYEVISHNPEERQSMEDFVQAYFIQMMG